MTIETIISIIDLRIMVTIEITILLETVITVIIMVTEEILIEITLKIIMEETLTVIITSIEITEMASQIIMEDKIISETMDRMVDSQETVDLTEMVKTVATTMADSVEVNVH